MGTRRTRWCRTNPADRSALAQSGGLDDGHVDVLQSRARHDVPPGIAEAAEWGHGERGGVEPTLRTDRRWLSPVVLMTDTLTFCNPGPVTMFRPALPKLPNGDTANAVVSNQPCGQIGAGSVRLS